MTTYDEALIQSSHALTSSSLLPQSG